MLITHKILNIILVWLVEKIKKKKKKGQIEYKKRKKKMS